MEERSFNAFEPGLLVHLTLGQYLMDPRRVLVFFGLICRPGPAFPDGKGEEIGILKDYNLHVGGHQG